MALNPMPGWLGPSYTLASVNAACQRSLNLYPRELEAGDKVAGMLAGSPGLSAAILTLPTAPLRGLLAGSNRMFAVAGSKLYEISSTGTIIGLGGPTDHTARGDVGNNAANSPVQMFPNGKQLGIVSAGCFYCDSGLGPVQQSYTPFNYADIAVGWSGTCTCIGPFVTWQSGMLFTAGMVGSFITINGAGLYLITAVGMTTPLPGSGASSVPYLTTTGSGTNYFTPVPFIAGSGNIVNSVASPFGAADVGATLTFNGSAPFSALGYTINSVDGNGNATLSGIPAAVGSTGGVAVETFPAFGAATGAFLDSYFVVSPPSSKQFNVSALLDGSTWDSSDEAAKESYPDNIVALFQDHEELYVMGEVKSEVWASPGVDENFPFQRNPSACMSLGIAATASMCGFVDGVAWLGASLNGPPVAWYARGFQPERISTDAIEALWKTFTTVADAVAFAYELDGHEFWQIAFPSADQTTPGDGLGQTWVYDRTASLKFGAPYWHEVNSFNGTVWTRHRAGFHCFVFGKHWVGDWGNGNIYQMDSTIYQDAGQTITCIRTLPHLCGQRLRQFFSKWQTDLETAQGFVPPSTPGVALTIMLEWSDDGGHTFVGGGTNFTYTTSTLKTLDRAVFWQLGSADDRVFRLTVTGNGRKALLNAYLDYTLGIS